MQQQQQQASHNSCYMQFIFRCCILMKSAKKKKKNKREVGEREAKQHERELFHYILVICGAVFLTACKLENWHTHTHREAEQLHCCMRVYVSVCVCGKLKKLESKPVGSQTWHLYAG